MITELGSDVLHSACAQPTGWRAIHPAHCQLQVSVNVSPDQLDETSSRTQQALGENNLPATALVLEITETNLLHDSETALAQLAQLRSLGIQIAIDDFGAGYSSLRYLRRFPVDILKIAKPFIDDSDQADGQEWAFARLITDLATTLGLTIVAEGIEVAGQHDRLVKLGCAYGQGYFYAHPIDASNVDALLAADTAQQLQARAA
jgi:EAL domain-containing protein (putative c-di-GMP-specific phosphodiesterase class I)